jgi:hypothetical protein
MYPFNTKYFIWKSEQLGFIGNKQLPPKTKHFRMTKTKKGWK